MNNYLTIDFIFSFPVPIGPPTNLQGYGANPAYGTTTPSHQQYQMGFVNNPESALVPKAVNVNVPTLTPSTPPVAAINGAGGVAGTSQSITSSFTVAPRARRPSEKVADDNLIDLDGLGQSLDK